MELEIECTDINISKSYRGMTAIVDVDESDIVSQMGIEKILEIIGTDAILNVIGIRNAIDHFGEEEIIEEINPLPNFETI
jgi:hypothetical protein